MIYENDEYKLTLYKDDDALKYSTRYMFDSISTLIVKKIDNYDLGDIKTLENPIDAVAVYLGISVTHLEYDDECDIYEITEKPLEQLVEEIKSQVLLYPLYNDSREIDKIRLNVDTNLVGYNPWNSASLGFAVIRLDWVEENYGTLTPKVEEDILFKLREELQLYTTYLNGDVYRYELRRKYTCPQCSNSEYELIQNYFDIYGTDVYNNGVYDSLDMDDDAKHRLLKFENLTN